MDGNPGMTIIGRQQDSSPKYGLASQLQHQRNFAEITGIFVPSFRPTICYPASRETSLPD
jgi:hypothetical protein